jgi:predicted small metal-binding protein
MARQITCECGYIARSQTEDEVVDLIQEHLRSDHPQLLAQLTREDIAGWVEIVE